MRKNPSQALLFLVLVLLGNSPVAAQESDSRVFVETLDVDLINVEVFVTDRKGRPVAGLEAADFEIFEDGSPVEITNFFTVSRPDRVLTGLDRGLEELGESPRAVDLEPLPEDQKLHLAIYVDHFNLRPEHRRQVLDDLRGFVEDRLIQGDRIMLVGYHRQLDVTVPFSRDRQALFEGLRKMERVAAHRPADDGQRRRVMSFMSQAASDDPDDPARNLRNAHQILRTYVEKVKSDLRFTTRALQQFVRSLAGLPGRKAVLYVSSGLPQRPGEELYQHLANIFGDVTETLELRAGDFVDPSIEALREDESQLFAQVTREANSHEVTFYTLDARGASGSSTFSAEFPVLSPTPGGRTLLDQIRTHNLQEPLLGMAATTGGRAILDTNNFEGSMIGLADDFDTFYSLGYRPPSGRDGKYHKIEVRVKRPGMTARHRAGYESKPEVERVADRTLSSLLLGLEKNPLGIKIDFLPPEKVGAGKLELPVLIRVPIDQVTLLYQETSAEGRLQFFLVVQDEEGISDLHNRPYPVSIPSDQIERAQGREIAYAVKLKIRKGTPKVAVGVWDELSGVESFVHQRVLLEDPKSAKPRRAKKRRG